MIEHANIEPFPFTRDGNANRRDSDALPRVLVQGVDLDSYELHFHQAGHGCIQSVPLVAIRINDPLIEGMDPLDAWRVGGWCELALAAWRDVQEKAAEAPA